MESFNEAWDIICNYCRTKITNVAYDTWIKRIVPVGLDFDTGEAILEAPNEFHKKTISRCYKDLLCEAFEQVFGSEIKVVLTSADSKKPTETKSKENTVSQTPFYSSVRSGDNDYEFTFDTFIVGSSNKFTHAACVAVANNPAGAYNPLFIYGNSGLGKTHLLYAICNEVKKTQPDKYIVYIKGDDFTNELINSIRTGSTLEFHDKYRNADILLVDDIQFIAGKDSTQEEFFHTFNTLYEAKKQIVLTSDRPPKEIKTLEDRLRTRFEWGLISDIQPPDYETRIAIIKRKAELLDFNMPNDVCDYIANKLKTNIRQLEGTVKKMKAYYTLTGDMPNLSVAKSAIDEILNDDRSPVVTTENILEEVSRTYNVSIDDIKSTRRSANIAKARRVAMYILRENTSLSLAQIGKEFGGRDHSTVVYSIQQAEKEIKKDKRLRETIEDITKNINSI